MTPSSYFSKKVTWFQAGFVQDYQILGIFH
jgi:hypothetical protein